MNIDVTFDINSTNNIIIIRRKIFDLLSALTTNSYLQSKICSDYSETAKVSLKNNKQLQLIVFLNYELGVFNLTLIYCFNDSDPSSLLNKKVIYTLDCLVEYIPTEISLKAILVSKSRDELFDDIKEKNNLLQISTTEAQRAMQVKSDFMSNMSHEIRTPMNAIIGMTHLLLKSDLTVQQKNYLDRIQQSSEHLLNIVNDILDFSKIESGNMKLDITLFQLSDLLVNIFNNSSLKCEEKGIELLCEVEQDVPIEFSGDLLRISQILINFVSNAVKFTQQGEITIMISMSNRIDNSCTILFEVLDTGCGINEEGKENLFKSFQQADNSTTRKYGGTGLGLSISKQLAELMDGSVGFSSQEGVGSNFWLTVPLESPLQNTTLQQVGTNFVGIKALVVDDNEFALKVFSNQLMRLGFVVEKFSSAQKALDFIRTTNQNNLDIQAVFVDQKMPQMDGLEFAKKLSELQLTHTPKLVLLASIVLSSVETLNNLFQEVLYKPVHTSSLLDTISNLFQSSHLLENKKSIKNSLISPANSMLLSGIRILLVEDNLINQEVAVGLLDQLNSDILVEIAENGEIAVQKSKVDSWDLIFMDVHMPVMDGIEATILIRKDPTLSHIPIIALTANVLQADKNQYAEIGMNDFLAKPINPNDLYKILFKWIKPDNKNHAIFIKNSLTSSTQESITINKYSPDKNQSEPPPVSLSNIKTVNTLVGLQFTNGDEKLYSSILKKFMLQHHNFGQTINKLLEESDYRSAERLAHTLKSTAGSIGAGHISIAASALEKHIASNQEVKKSLGLANDISAQLIPIIHELQLYFPQAAEIKVIAVVEDKELRSICLNLANLLQENDIQSITFFGENDLILRSAFKDHYIELESHMKNYDFALAFDILKKSCQKNNISL